LRILQERGLHILAVDWRCRIGQVDIVAEDGGTVVIVEVKARRGTGFGLPSEAVDARKRRKLRLLAHAWAAAEGRPGAALRIDVIGLLLDARLRVVEVAHIEDAVHGD